MLYGYQKSYNIYQLPVFALKFTYLTVFTLHSEKLIGKDDRLLSVIMEIGLSRRSALLFNVQL